MEIKTHKSIHPLLKKYVLYYYETTLHNAAYYAYPHFNTPVSYTYDSDIALTDSNGVHFQTKKGNGNFFFTLNKFTKPLHITSGANLYEFNIVFTPFGLAQFGNKLSMTSSDSKNTIIPLFKHFEDATSQFKAASITDKIERLEKYLLSTFSPIDGTDIVEEALYYMHNYELSISEIAHKCNCSQKKLYRLFVSICGAKPSILKKIIRFRKALEQVKMIDNSFNLTDIAFGNGYYDQPYFNKEFKRLTGEKPKTFFNQVDIKTDENIYFKNC